MIPSAYEEAASKIKAVILTAPFFEKYDDFTQHLMQESGLEGERFFKALRLLLSGSQEGPDLAQMYPFIKNYMTEIVK